MAITQPLVDNRSGSVAGNTWSHNRGGSYVRRRVVPVNPTTTRQTAMRTAMSNGSRRWNDLTNAQRTGWTNYANTNPVLNRLGMSIHLTGISMFNRINQVSQDSGSGYIDTAPSGVGPALWTTMAVTSTGGNVILTYTATPLGAGKRLAVWWTGAGRVGQNPNRKQARLVGYTALAAASPQSIALPATFPVGAVSNFYVCVLDSFGRQTPTYKFRTTAT